MNLIFLSGIAVKIKALKDNFFIPSFDLIDNSKYYLQNLPSIICAKVLDSKENELILDMCAAPGGKTTHIAALVNNNVVICSIINTYLFLISTKIINK